MQWGVYEPIEDQEPKSWQDTTEEPTEKTPPEFNPRLTIPPEPEFGPGEIMCDIPDDPFEVKTPNDARLLVVKCMYAIADAFPEHVLMQGLAGDLGRVYADAVKAQMDAPLIVGGDALDEFTRHYRSPADISRALWEGLEETTQDFSSVKRVTPTLVVKAVSIYGFGDVSVKAINAVYHCGWELKCLGDIADFGFSSLSEWQPRERHYKDRNYVTDVRRGQFRLGGAASGPVMADIEVYPSESVYEGS